MQMQDDSNYVCKCEYGKRVDCLSKQRRDRTSKRKLLVEYMGGECNGCRLLHIGTNTYLFDLHHVNSADKQFGLAVSDMNRRWTLLCKEADKCILLCSNCHRTEHHKIQ